MNEYETSIQLQVTGAKVSYNYETQNLLVTYLMQGVSSFNCVSLHHTEYTVYRIFLTVTLATVIKQCGNSISYCIFW